MSARVLIVDDFAPNLKLLEARLTEDYFEVISAMNGPEALAICAQGACDIVLLDIMMPGMDGFEVCRRLKRDPVTHHIPVVIVTALDQPTDRLRGLEAGADDFLTKPIDELALIARVRSLTRLKVVLDELRARAASSATLGMHDPILRAMRDDVLGAKILLVEDRPSAAATLKAVFERTHDITVEADPQEALFKGVEGQYDLFVISLGLKNYDSLRLCSQFRSLERTRSVPILILAEPEDRQRVLRGLDLGVNDYLLRPIDRNELMARSRTQLRRKRYADSLRDNVQASIEMAVTDTLTGLNNRRFFDGHFKTMIDQAARRGRPLALMILDIDYFKKVNDTFGHEAGDLVLKAFAARLKRVTRSSDLICRLGGEEFAILMPETTLDVAVRVAERLRGVVEDDLFEIHPDKAGLRVTTSIGLAERGRDHDMAVMMRRADEALYQSKGAGRNRVTADAA